MKPLLMHLPLIGVLLIVGIVALVEADWLSGLRTETTYGWMVVVWYPVGILLALVQLALWIRWLLTRG